MPNTLLYNTGIIYQMHFQSTFNILFKYTKVIMTVLIHAANNVYVFIFYIFQFELL